MSREKAIKAFLKKSEWGDAERQPVAGDASFRRYERLLKKNGKRAILMDAPPPKENVRPFMNIDGYLRRRGFSAPEIFASDEEQGFLLLEDLGNDSYTKLLSGESALSDKYSELELYRAAVGVLVQLHRVTLPRNMPDYDDKLLMEESKLLVNWYLPKVSENKILEEASEAYIEIWKKLFQYKQVGREEGVLVLRDYHADNLMWLPGREGVERVGLLDFQDAVVGAPTYDLVSLLEDARRDVEPEIVQAMIDYYLSERSLLKREEFLASYAVLAAQRNCKIIGIFARLAVRDNKPRYLNYLPRVWGHLERGLSHPVLAPLKLWLDNYVPPEKRNPSAFTMALDAPKLKAEPCQ